VEPERVIPMMNRTLTFSVTEGEGRLGHDDGRRFALV
jgi:hypothetical protein